MIYYINYSSATNRWKVYAQDGTEVCIATFDTRKEAEKYIDELEDKK